MQIDIDYLKKLLISFEDSNRAFTNILEFQEKGYDIDTEMFIFHMQILSDKGIIANELDVDFGIGLSRTGGGNPNWRIVNLRLTASGHDFIESLKNKEVWNKLQSDFKNTGITTLLDVSKKLLVKYLEKKIGL